MKPPLVHTLGSTHLLRDSGFVQSDVGTQCAGASGAVFDVMIQHTGRNLPVDENMGRIKRDSNFGDFDRAMVMENGITFRIAYAIRLALEIATKSSTDVDIWLAAPNDHTLRCAPPLERSEETPEEIKRTFGFGEPPHAAVFRRGIRTPFSG